MTDPSAGPDTGPSDPHLRLRLDFAYDGTDFSGWAAQPGLRTVEGELTAALVRILRLREPARVTVAGRTDAGVHALGAVAHVDVPASAWAALPGRSRRPPADAALTRLAGVLPGDVVVRRVAPAPDGFDARFSATSRRYAYRLCDVTGGLDPLRRRDTVTVQGPLDLDAMNAASAALCGLQDFAAFCKRREGATTVRTLLTFDWHRTGPLVVGRVVADAFCHSMVRSLVGAVVPVGQGRRPVAWPAQVLSAARRDSGVTVMPAHGLSLAEVAYPPEHELAARAHAARRRRDEPPAAVEPGPGQDARG